MGLVIRLLGPPQVIVDGRPLDVDTRKAVALLARLAVGEPRVARDVLAALFWPEASHDRARASLRRTLSSLTSGLDGRWVSADRTTVCLDLDEVDCDVATFRALAERTAAHGHAPTVACDDCRRDLTTAATLHAGDLLDGFALRDAPAFDDWVLLERETLRRQAGTVLERLVDQHVAAGALDDALTVGRRWVAMDPLHEAAHRAVIRVAAWAGRRDEVTRQFQACVAVLDEELGVSPLPPTVELYRAVLDGTVPSRPADVPPRAAPPAHREHAEGELVGRAPQLDALTTLLDPDPRVRLAVVEGEAGIGKTRLVAELTRVGGSRGHGTLVARCHEGEEGMVCGPLVDALRDAHRADPTLPDRLAPDVAAEVGRVLPTMAGPDGAATTDLALPGAKTRFFDALGAALAAATPGTAPGLLVVEDLHWSDATTREVLGYLARRPVASGPAVVGTWRTEAVPHDHPLRVLTRQAGARHVVLDRLGPAEVAALVADRRPELAALADRLHAETEGIPFFVVQYLEAWDGTEDWQLPASVRDLLRTRLLPTSELARQCLTAAAVMARHFDTTALARVSGRSEDEVVTAVDELLALGLVREEPDGATYDFSHARIREVALEDASQARRRLLHRRAAEALARDTRGDAVAATEARHLEAAGMEQQAALAHARAADHARRLFAHDEAMAHLEAALALRHPDPAGVHRRIGDLHVLSGRYAAARSSYETAVARADDEEARAAIEHRLAALALRQGDWAQARHHLDEALRRRPPNDHAALARLVADLALVELRSGNLGAATAHASRARAAAVAAADPLSIAATHNVAGLVARRAGDLQAARTLLDTAIAAASGVDDPGPRVAALNNLSLVQASEGALEDALATAREALELGHRSGDLHRQAALHSNVADRLHALGRTDDALAHLRTSAQLLVDVGETPAPEPEIWKLTDW